MIKIVPKARNAEAMKELREIAVDRGARSLTRIIESGTNSIASAMATLHGGRWNVTVNHDSCFVLISREIDRRPLEAQSR